MIASTTLRGVRIAAWFAGIAAAVGCAAGAAPPTAAQPEPEPVSAEPPLPTLEERRAAPFAVLSSGRAVPYRVTPGASTRRGRPNPEPQTGGTATGDAASTDRPRRPSEGAPETSDFARVRDRTHRVVRGDTLWNISRRYGVALEDIRRANAMNDDVVRIGQLLIIPQGD